VNRIVRRDQVRRLPIVDSDGKLVGIVTMEYLLWILARELGNMAEGAVRPVLEEVDKRS
jgi:CBS domain-containing protein